MPLDIPLWALALLAAVWVVGAVLVTTLPVAAGPLLSLLVLAPLSEEWVFRAGLQRSLLQRGLPAWLAVLATALVFALLHGLTRSPALGVAVLPAALLLGLLYQHSRSAAACVALHAALNLAWWLVARAGLAPAALLQL